ncbi:MAG: hypothetical protein VX619_07200 [bacterium]|nr:hypothetical protein [bacterium]
MSFRVILIYWLLVHTCSTLWSSTYIFVEDTGSIGSLKGLLKENLNNNDIETLGYTPQSLNVVLNKTNKLQTSMVWILRESFESEALILSRCGQFEHNQYIDGLIKSIINKKSKIPRLYIGWIPYKNLGQITSQCILLEVPQTFDLASLALELTELFKSQTEFPTEDILEPSLEEKSEVLPVVKNEIQQSKKIPMQWGQFRRASSQKSGDLVSQSIQKISYDPDEDLFLTPFINTALETKNQSDDEKLKLLGDTNFLSSKETTRTITSTQTEKGAADSVVNLDDTSEIFNKLVEKEPTKDLKRILKANSLTKLNETTILLKPEKSIISSSIITHSIQKTKIQTKFTSGINSNLSSLKALYMATNTNIIEKLDKTILEKNSQKSSLVFSDQQRKAERLKTDETKNKNLMKELRSDFRKELLDKFRKEKGRQAPEWLFEE